MKNLHIDPNIENQQIDMQSWQDDPVEMKNFLFNKEMTLLFAHPGGTPLFDYFVLIADETFFI